MKNDYDLSNYDYRGSAAFRRMEAIASSLVADDPRLLASTKLFRDKVQSSVREQNLQILSGIYKSPQGNEPSPLNVEELAARLEKARGALENQRQINGELRARFDGQVFAFVERQLELEAELARAAERLELAYKNF